MKSLRARLVLAASVVLVAFLGATGLSLQRAYRASSLELVQERLQAQIYALLAAAETSAAGALELPEALPEPRYSVPDSGLYGLILGADGVPVWQSRSMLGRELRPPAPARPGVALFTELATTTGERLFVLGFRVRWESDSGSARLFDLHVAESRAEFDAQLSSFRHGLWVWLGVAALMLLAAQALVLSWSLAPLRRLASELAEVELGERSRLSVNQPQELHALTANMNQLIGTGRRLLERHRNALADLAHSLKTPLAVLRTQAEQAADARTLRATILETVTRMDESLAYQLRRASVAGDSPLSGPQCLAPTAERLRASLLKVHADRGLALELAIDPELRVRADPGDLMEILGNLMDNACKWARSRVRVEARAERGDGDAAAGVEITVDDDGPGLPESQWQRVLARGGRADERAAGDGIGLAVVHELVVDQYGGSLEARPSPLGGARLIVRLAGVDR